MAGIVAWFTGLSGSGKTTIAQRAEEILREGGRKVLMLDGDVVRTKLHRHLGFSPEDIRENNRLIVGLCEAAIAEYDLVLVPIISPFRESRAAARSALGRAFVEVYVQATLVEVIRRDPKGLYREAKQGRRSNLIGVSDELPYEPPITPELVLDTGKHDVETCARQLTEYLLGSASPTSPRLRLCDESNTA